MPACQRKTTKTIKVEKTVNWDNLASNKTEERQAIIRQIRGKVQKRQNQKKKKDIMHYEKQQKFYIKMSKKKEKQGKTNRNEAIKWRFQ